MGGLQRPFAVWRHPCQRRLCGLRHAQWRAGLSRDGLGACLCIDWGLAVGSVSVAFSFQWPRAEQLVGLEYGNHCSEERDAAGRSCWEVELQWSGCMALEAALGDNDMDFSKLSGVQDCLGDGLGASICNYQRAGSRKRLFASSMGEMAVSGAPRFGQLVPRPRLGRLTAPCSARLVVVSAACAPLALPLTWQADLCLAHSP